MRADGKTSLYKVCLLLLLSYRTGQLAMPPYQDLTMGNLPLKAH